MCIRDSDNAAVGVVIAVENEGLQGRVRVALRAGKVLHDVFEHRVDVDALLEMCIRDSI